MQKRVKLLRTVEQYKEEAHNQPRAGANGWALKQSYTVFPLLVLSDKVLGGSYAFESKGLSLYITQFHFRGLR